MHLTHKLVVQQYVLDLLEVSDFKDLALELKPVPEGDHEDGRTHFSLTLLSRTVERQNLPDDQLRQYDDNIRKHTEWINRQRSEPIQWKYFQYLALLFTEIFLDRFFKDPHGLCTELNRKLHQINEELGASEKLVDVDARPRAPYPPATYSLNDLTKLAFLQATGSGKTLQMHINILQYLHYRRLNGQTPPDRILILTPNEGLSHQHLKDARDSGFAAELFDKNAPSGQGRLGVAVDIIDVHKLDEVAGEKTVAVDSFEGNNLLLVDEGHRGASGVDWMDKRARLCADGFSFEYSATFTQAVNAASGNKKKSLEALYARCILFDYSYKWFHGDGFGKDYRIRNLDLARDMGIGEHEQRELYLTACILGFYQQMRIYLDRETSLRPWRIEEPLLVFVGSKVTVGYNKDEASDIVEVCSFLNRFTREKSQTVERLRRLLSDEPALTNDAGKDLFYRSFDYLRGLDEPASDHFEKMLRLVFNGDGNTGGRIHLDLLKGTAGEIGIRFGDGEYFGVINVGDASKLHKALEEASLSTGARDFSDSLFRGINGPHSPVKMLLGSKKFTEGWSSYRVSAMGLLNVGRSEGTQIIQLFGRGVRLRGYAGALKRSEFTDIPKKQRPGFLKYLETLNVFGIRADFMADFRKFLEGEGLPPDPDATKITLPVLSTLPVGRELKVLDLPEGTNFKKQGPRPTVNGSPHEIFRRYPVELNWYPRIREVGNRETSSTDSLLHKGKLEAKHLAFIDFDALYLDLVEYKHLQRWNTLNITEAGLRLLLERGGTSEEWYHLYIPQEDLRFNRYAMRHIWQEIATVLLRKYLDRFYKTAKAEWENERLVYRTVSAGDTERSYHFQVEPNQDSLYGELLALKEAIETKQLAEIEARKAKTSGLQIVTWEGSLFQPLIFMKEKVIRLSKLALQESEKVFVNDLILYAKSEPDSLKNKELYLLRNSTKSQGLGFFDAGGFFPDFILWIVDGEQQKVCFVDPHGLGREKKTSPKIALARKIKEHQHRLADAKISLESFILSPTPYTETQLETDWSLAQCSDNHVLFMDRSDYVEQLFRLTEGGG